MFKVKYEKEKSNLASSNFIRMESLLDHADYIIKYTGGKLDGLSEFYKSEVADFKEDLIHNSDIYVNPDYFLREKKKDKLNYGEVRIVNLRDENKVDYELIRDVDVNSLIEDKLGRLHDTLLDNFINLDIVLSDKVYNSYLTYRELLNLEDKSITFMDQFIKLESKRLDELEDNLSKNLDPESFSNYLDNYIKSVYKDKNLVMGLYRDIDNSRNAKDMDSNLDKYLDKIDCLIEQRRK